MGVPLSDADGVHRGGGAAAYQAAAARQALAALAVRRVGRAGAEGAAAGLDGEGRCPAARAVGGDAEERRGAGARLGLQRCVRAHTAAPCPAQDRCRAGERDGLAVHRLRRRGAAHAGLVRPALCASARAAAARLGGGGGGAGGRCVGSGEIRPAALPGGGRAGAENGLRLRRFPPRAGGAGGGRAGRKGDTARAAAPEAPRRAAKCVLVLPARAALVRPLHAVCFRPRGERHGVALRPAGAGTAGGRGAARIRRHIARNGEPRLCPRAGHQLHLQRREEHRPPHRGHRPLQALSARHGADSRVYGRDAVCGPAHRRGGRSQRPAAAGPSQ